MSALLKLLELSPGDDTDIWVGSPSGPDGKRAYGGQFVAQSLAAACHTVDADRPPTNMHLQFLRGSEAGDPIEYTVARVFDGRTAAARRVDSREGGRLLTTATVSFAAELPGPEHGNRPDMSGDPDALPWRAFESTSSLEVTRLIGEFAVGEDVSANHAHAERVVEPGPFGLEVGHVGGVGGDQ